MDDGQKSGPKVTVSAMTDDGCASEVKPPDSFEVFFADYLRKHSQPATRALHLAGTGVATLLVLAALANPRQRLPFLLAAPLAGYGPAWLSHVLVEHNHPATFHHPIWALWADYRMLWLWLTGRLEEALRCAGIESPSLYREAQVNCPGKVAP